MEKFMEMLSPEDQQELKNLAKITLPDSERTQLWGHNISPGFSADAIKYAYEKWNVRKNDVFLVSYPKTGTNFVSEIIRRILFQDKKMEELSKRIPVPMIVIEFRGGDGKKKFDLIDKMPLERRLFGTHLPSHLMNIDKMKEAKAKVVYVIRNPKDQIVSWFNFAKKLPPGQEEPWKTMLDSGWDKFFNHVIAGDFEMHNKHGEWYPEHILSWYKHRDNKTVYFVYFEDLKKDPVKEIKLIAEFLETPISEDKAKEIAEETSFDKMKQEAETSDNEALKQFRLMNMRKGGVGGWKDHFTVSQSERIDAIMEEKLKDTDITFSYE